MKKLQHGFALVESLIIILILAAIGFGGYKVYKNHQTKPKPQTVSSAPAKTEIKATPAPDPYADWKTYTVPENKAISFKYPSDWTVVANYYDTQSSQPERFVKIVAPETYKKLPFVLIFRYDVGDNSKNDQCGATTTSLGVVKADDITIKGKKLKILTESGTIDNIVLTGVSLADASLCPVAVTGGTVSMSESNAYQSAPTESLSLATWESLPESTTFPLIFKSLTF